MNNIEKLKKLGLQDYYYYCFDGKDIANIGQVVVCLLVTPDKQLMSRGIAICSPVDVFSKREGRHIALGRAVQAIEHEGSIEPINERKFFYGENVALAFARSYGCKAVYKPTIANRIEKRILNRKAKEVNV